MRFRKAVGLFLVGIMAASTLVALEVAIVAPEPGQFIAGLVEVRADVYPLGTEARVDFYLDGLRVGVAERPPFTFVMDVGEENVPHTIEVLALGADGARATATLSTPTLRTDEEIDVTLQQLYVTVESDGARLLDLDRGDFTILDDGKEQDIVTFERGDVPFTAVLLIDASVSMQGTRLPTALRGAKEFVRRMNPLDETKLTLFSDHVLAETPFTQFESVLTVTLAGVRARGGTALNDALYLGLKRLEARQGRKVVILLSDGIDVESVLSMKDVRNLANGSQAVIYWIRLPRDEGEEDVKRYSSWRNAEGHAEELDQLHETVLEQGGRIETIDNLAEVESALQRVLRELREQYVIGYYPTQKRGTGTWHEVKVQLPSGTLDIRTRLGYLEG